MLPPGAREERSQIDAAYDRISGRLDPDALGLVERLFDLNNHALTAALEGADLDAVASAATGGALEAASLEPEPCEIDRERAAGIANAMKAHAVDMSRDRPYRAMALDAAKEWERIAEGHHVGREAVGANA